MRAIERASLDFGACNVIIGDNGSGKTSLLEAVHILARGKSFRAHKPSHYIRYGAPYCVVRAYDDTQILALQKFADAKTIIKQNDTNISQSALTQLLPICVIDPSGMELLEMGSESRRAMLDWLLFHVKLDFYPTWQCYQQALKQRNTLLRMRHASAMHNPWAQILGAQGEQLHELRRGVMADWQRYFSQAIQTLLPKYADLISLHYHAGFDTNVPLCDTLMARLPSDTELGYTRMGAHRADVRILCDTRTAVQVLSRGEKKLLIVALRVSALQMMCAHGAMPMVLIDDIHAELDAHAITRLLSILVKLPAQYCITMLERSPLVQIGALWQDVLAYRVAEGKCRLD